MSFNYYEKKEYVIEHGDGFRYRIIPEESGIKLYYEEYRKTDQHGDREWVEVSNIGFPSKTIVDKLIEVLNKEKNNIEEDV